MCICVRASACVPDNPESCFWVLDLDTCRIIVESLSLLLQLLTGTIQPNRLTNEPFP